MGVSGPVEGIHKPNSRRDMVVRKGPQRHDKVRTSPSNVFISRLVKRVVSEESMKDIDSNDTSIEVVQSHIVSQLLLLKFVSFNNT